MITIMYVTKYYRVRVCMGKCLCFLRFLLFFGGVLGGGAGRNIDLQNGQHAYALANVGVFNEFVNATQNLPGPVIRQDHSIWDMHEVT